MHCGIPPAGRPSGEEDDDYAFSCGKLDFDLLSPKGDEKKDFRSGKKREAASN